MGEIEAINARLSYQTTYALKSIGVDGIRRKLAQYGASSQHFSSAGIAGVAHRVSNLKV
jgi:hypothetical protein